MCCPYCLREFCACVFRNRKYSKADNQFLVVQNEGNIGADVEKDDYQSRTNKVADRINWS